MIGQLSPDGLWWWDGSTWQPTGTRRPALAYRPGGTLGWWVTGLLVALVVLGVLALPMLAVYYSPLGQALVTDADLAGVGAQLFAVQAINLVVLVATVVLFCVWTYRVASNLAALGSTELEFTPGWAVGWWFIPFVNLVQPFRAMAEVWRASEPSASVLGRVARRRLPLGWQIPTWWCLLVATVIAPLAIEFMSGIWSALATPTATAQISALTTLITVIVDRVLGVCAALAAIAVVRGIDGRQQRLRGMR